MGKIKTSKVVVVQHEDVEGVVYRVSTGDESVRLDECNSVGETQRSLEIPVQLAHQVASVLSNAAWTVSNNNVSDDDQDVEAAF